MRAGTQIFCACFVFLGLSQFRLHFLSNFRSFCTESSGTGYAKEVAVVIRFLAILFCSNLSYFEKRNYYFFVCFFVVPYDDREDNEE